MKIPILPLSGKALEHQWNDFAPESFPQEEFLIWIEKVVYITNHDLDCTKVAVDKQGYVTGFTGNVEFAVDFKASRNSGFERLLTAPQLIVAQGIKPPLG